MAETKWSITAGIPSLGATGEIKWSICAGIPTRTEQGLTQSATLPSAVTQSAPRLQMFLVQASALTSAVTQPAPAIPLVPCVITANVKPTYETHYFTGSNDDALDNAIWDVSVGTNCTVDINNNRGLFHHAAGTAGNATARYRGSPISGDFDVEVRVVDSLQGNATWHAGFLRFEIDSTHYMEVEHYRSFNNLRYVARWRNGNGEQTAESAWRNYDNGYLRLVRKGNTVRTYYDDFTKDAWVEINAGGEAIGNGDGDISIGLRMTTTIEAWYEFDDFLLTNKIQQDVPLVPSTISEAVSQPVPILEQGQTITQAASLDSAVTQPVPIVTSDITITQAASLDTAVTQSAPEINLIIRPAALSAAVTQPTPELISSQTLEPSTISAAVTQELTLCQHSHLQTNFSEYTADQQPSDWTERWCDDRATSITKESSTGDWLGNKYIHRDHSSYGEYLLSWDKLDGATNVEILARVSCGEELNNVIFLVTRGSGGCGSEYAYYADCQWSSNIVYVKRLSSGGSYNIDPAYLNLVVDEHYWVRFRVIGTSLKAKVWKDGDSEPGTWGADTTHAGITNGGWVGLGSYRGDLGYIDFFSVALDGGTAKGPEAITMVSHDFAVTQPGPTMEMYLEPSTHEAPVSFANPQVQCPQAVEPDYVSQPVTVNAPTDLDITIKPQAHLYGVTQPNPRTNWIFPGSVEAAVTQPTPEVTASQIVTQAVALTSAVTQSDPSIPLVPCVITATVKPSYDTHYFTGTNDDRLDNAVWDVWEESATTTVDINSNRARFHSSSGNSNECNATYRGIVSGDFDVEVRIPNALTGNATWHSGYLRFEIDSTHYSLVEFYRGFNSLLWRARYRNGNGEQTPDTDTRISGNGYLRLVRKGSTVRTFYDDGTKSAWTELDAGGQAIGSGDGKIIIGLDKNTTIETWYEFDDFLLTSKQPQDLPLVPAVISEAVTQPVPQVTIDQEVTQASSLDSAVTQAAPTLEVYLGFAAALTSDGAVQAPADIYYAVGPSVISQAVSQANPNVITPLIPYNNIAHAVTQEAPILRMYVEQTQVPSSAVTQYTPQITFTIRPASISQAITQAYPHVQLMTLQPAAISQAVTLPMPIAGEVLTIVTAPSISGTVNAPDFAVRIKAHYHPFPVSALGPDLIAAQVLQPGIIAAYASIGEPTVTASIDLQPGVISQVVAVQDPRLDVELYPARLQVASTLPAPHLYTAIIPFVGPGLTIQVQVQKPTAFVFDQPQDIYPQPVPVYSSIGEPTVATEEDIQVDILSQPVSLPAPDIALTIRPEAVISVVTTLIGQVWTDIMPATAEASIALPAPELAYTIKPAVLSSLVQQDAPTLRLHLLPESFVQTVAPQDAKLTAYIKPEAVAQGVLQANPYLLLGVTIQPAMISAAATQPDPRLQVNVVPALLSQAVTQPTPALVWEQMLQPSVLEAAATLPTPEIYKHLELLYPDALETAVQLPNPGLWKSLEIVYPDVLEAPVLQPFPEVAPFHTFRSLYISAAWAEERNVMTQYINLVNR